ncbi:MAG: ABC transporter ATP-binding protein/permease [Desulfobacterales bacterium]|nr:ABC transporter ATP-binding protein/permease [Desulfobacterales bacterium]
MKSTYLIKPYIWNNRFRILIGLAALIVVDFFQLLIPRVIKLAVDDLTIMDSDSSRLLKYALYLVFLAFLIASFRYIWRHFLIGFSRHVEEGLRNKLFFHLQILSASYYNRVTTGDIMAHATNDIMHIRMALGMGIVALTDAVVLGIAAIGFMAYINIKLTLFALIPTPFIILGTKFFSKKMHRLYGDVQASFSDLTEAVREQFAGIRIVKAYNLEETELAGFKKTSGDYIKKNIALVKITGSFFPLMVFFTNLSLAFVIYLGGRQAVLNIITPGDLVAVISYLGLLTWPMMAMGWVANLIQRGAASLDRLDKIFQTRSDITDAADAVSIEKITKDITFHNVNFSYSSHNRSALEQVSFSAGAGKTVGIVGPPGSGKTTLLGLIPRIFDTTGGTITADDIDICQIKTDDLRKNISSMAQEPYLFAGTIRENITFGNPDIDNDALDRAISGASLKNTIDSFPKGLETVVGEKGVILSGGQKQRIALARAILRDASIMLLDDPISQVDAATGTTIINTLHDMSGSRIIIIVSHRLSAVSRADNIIALDDGRIIESGTHDQLMAFDGYYAKTYRLQELEEELDV